MLNVVIRRLRSEDVNVVSLVRQVFEYGAVQPSARGRIGPEMPCYEFDVHDCAALRCPAFHAAIGITIVTIIDFAHPIGGNPHAFQKRHRVGVLQVKQCLGRIDNLIFGREVLRIPVGDQMGIGASHLEDDV